MQRSTAIRITMQSQLCFLNLSSRADSSPLSTITRSLHDLTDWQGLGVNLGLDYTDLETIGKKNGSDLDKCKTALIRQWLHSGHVTKSTLMAVLKNLGDSSIASTIEGR